MAMIEHAAFVFDVLMNSFYPKHDAKLPLKAKSPRKFPLFVTYNKSRSFDGKTNDYGLRGCIGTFNSQYLEDGLRMYALKAAKDSRFKPIAANELKDLSCTVSLLCKFESCTEWDDWEIGVHGIEIKFTADEIEYSATYLPHVATDNGWDHKKTVDNLVQKSGFRQQFSSDIYQKMLVVRYQTSKASVSFTTYCQKFLKEKPPNLGLE